MLVEIDLLGTTDKIANAIKLLKAYETIAIANNENGYYVGFSGGKDSLVIAYLCYLAKVKFELHENHTTADTPELVHFNKKIEVWFNNLGVSYYRHYPIESMWQLIPKKLYPPTRRVRYCCEVLKEKGGKSRFCITGVRWAESTKRRNNRELIEGNAYSAKKNIIKLSNDNDKGRRQIETCVMKGKHILNPILHWEDEDVWEFIKLYNIPYCKLYDQGWDRLGCIGCPLSSNQEKELNAYPKYKENYLRAFRRMTQERKRKGRTFWIDESDAEEIMEWWLHGTIKEKQIEGQMELELEEFEDLEEN